MRPASLAGLAADSRRRKCKVPTRSGPGLEGFVVELDDVRVVHKLDVAVLRLKVLAVELVMLREVVARKVEAQENVRQRVALVDGHGVRDLVSFP